jgi:hypothetical protein
VNSGLFKLLRVPCVYVYVCMFVCMYACKRVRGFWSEFRSFQAPLRPVRECVYACMYVCMYACMRVVRVNSVFMSCFASPVCIGCVCMYVCMYVCCMHVFMCGNGIDLFVQTLIWSRQCLDHIHIYKHTCMHTYIHAYRPRHIHTYSYLGVDIDVFVKIFLYGKDDVGSNSDIQTCMHAYKGHVTYTYIHTYIHTYSHLK